MPTFDERLRAAKDAPRPTRTVQVLLDAGLSEKRRELLEEMERARSGPADDRLTGVSPREKAEAAVQEKLDALLAESADSLVTLRFTRLPGDVWAEITDRAPARLDSPLDRHYGYNMHAVCRLAAPLCGARVEEGVDVPLLVRKASQDSPAVNQWDDLFATVTGLEARMIIDALYDLNEYEPAQRVDQLKKGLATRTV